jgi:hypothetical protein
VVAAAKSGQGAGTVIYENIVKMYSRRYGRNTQNYIWLINQDVEPQLQSMIAPGATFPAYLPPGGLSASPYGMLMGRPVLPLEACSALGTEGDIIFFDPTQYLVVMQSEGMRSDVSMHLYFDTDHLAFRFILRVGGQLYWPAGHRAAERVEHALAGRDAELDAHVSRTTEAVPAALVLLANRGRRVSSGRALSTEGATLLLVTLSEVPST